MALIDPAQVETIFKACLFEDDEDTTNHIPVHGIAMNAGLHPGRVREHTPEINDLLDQLPRDFGPSAGDGHGTSFLAAVKDREGNQWTDDQHVAQLLVMLGIAIGRIEFPYPRELWPLLAGGVPFLMVKDRPAPSEPGDSPEPHVCPRCGTRHEMVTAFGVGDKNAIPTEGAATVCAACGLPGIFTADLTIRTPDPHEMIEIAEAMAAMVELAEQGGDIVGRTIEIRPRFPGVALPGRRFR